MKKINVIGLVSLDKTYFDEKKTYLGGGAFATAWITSLFNINTDLYSISCHNEYNNIIKNNLRWNANLFSHFSFSSNKPMTVFEISSNGIDYFYKIQNLRTAANELTEFLITRQVNDIIKYIKLPYSDIVANSVFLSDESMNPQGKFDLIDFSSKVHTNGYIFLNKNELLNSCSGLDFFSALEYIESIRQSFIITLGIDGAICFDNDSNNWYYSPSIFSDEYVCSLGCGDAFAGGFLSGKFYDKTIPECMMIGTLSGYLLSLSPSNMPTKWFTPEANIDNFYRSFINEVKCFKHVEYLKSFLNTNKSKQYLLRDNFDVALSFDWEIRLSENVSKKLYFTYCSKSKKIYNIDKMVLPKELYISDRIQRFIEYCEEKNYEWAIFSDDYGLVLKDDKIKWYDKSPNSVSDDEYKKLLKDTLSKMDGYDDVIFYYDENTFHPLYQKLIDDLQKTKKIKLINMLGNQYE